PVPATTGSYTLSLHDALPIFNSCEHAHGVKHARGLGAQVLSTRFGSREMRAVHNGDIDTAGCQEGGGGRAGGSATNDQHLRGSRSEEHTSELQSRENLVCRRL